MKEFAKFGLKVLAVLAVYKVVKQPVLAALPESVRTTANTWLP